MVRLRKMLVEGTDDEHVVKHVCGQRALGKIDRMVQCGGKDALLDERLDVALKESDLFALGIVLDADENPQATWHAVRDRIRRAHYDDVPDELDADGLVLLPPSHALLPRIGVWLMPDNRTPGMLEDFLGGFVGAEDDLWPRAMAAVDSLQPPRFPAVRTSKARMHTWLAWQEEPGKPFGQAIAAHYLDARQPIADVFAGWLERTFQFGLDRT